MVRCRYCGFQFPSMYQFTNSRNVTIIGNTVQCPKCNRMTPDAPMGIDGTYDFDAQGNATEAGFFDVLKEAALSQEQLRRLQAAAQQARVHSASLQQFTEKVAEINPALGFKLNTYFEKHTYTIAALSLLLAVIQFVLGLVKPDETTKTVNNYNTYNITAPVSNPPNSTPTDRIAQRRLKKAAANPSSDALTPPSKKWHKHRRKK